MKYVIRAIKNKCGSVEGCCCMGPAEILGNWTTSPIVFPHRGMDLNKAHQLLQDSFSIPHKYSNNCVCEFKIEAWSI